MKIISRRFFLCSLFNRRRATTFSSFISTINIFVGILLLILIISLQDSRLNKSKSYQLETNMEYLQIKSDSQSIKTISKQKLKRKSSNDYYFRIDYTIRQSICQPVNVFQSKNAINTIRTMTIEELNGILSKNVKVHLNILRINGILKRTDRIKEEGGNQTEKLICSYVLELFVIFNFGSYCDDECQKMELITITSNRKLFGDLPNSSLKFSLADITPPDASILFHISDVAIYRTTKYLEKALFIQSAAERRFISTKYIHSNENESYVSMSIQDKSLFVMKKGLDMLDSSSVYVSFLSLSIPNLYLRHQDARVKIAKNDQSSLFRQDATFKLIFDYRNDVIALQTINLPQNYFVALSNDTEPALIVIPSQEQPTLDRFDERFIFKLITAS